MVGKKLKRTDIWKPNKDHSSPQRLVDYFVWLQAWLAGTEPDIACVEFLSVVRGAQATRVLSHYQAISVLACKLRGLMVVEARVKEARGVVLSSGGLDKEGAYAEVRKLFPDHQFEHKDKGGMDETDAVVLAVGARSLAER